MPAAAAGARGRRGARHLRRHPRSATSCCTTPTTRSTPVVDFLSRPRRDPTCWPSSRRSTASAATRPSSRRCWRPPPTASRWPCWWSSRRASTRRATSSWAQRAGARGRARRLRPARAQDALQDRARRAPRGRRHPPLRAPRHRQLQRRAPRSCTPTSACFTCDDDDRRRRHRPLQLPHRLLAPSGDYRKLLVAPVNLRERLEALIEREIEHAARRPATAHLIFKMNALVDQRDDPAALRGVAGRRAGRPASCAASAACGPGVPGVSENIRVQQHRRAASSSTAASTGSATAATRRSTSGSADLMPRNLDRRVEILFPVQDPAHRAAPARRDPRRRT